MALKNNNTQSSTNIINNNNVASTVDEFRNDILKLPLNLPALQVIPSTPPPPVDAIREKICTPKHKRKRKYSCGSDRIEIECIPEFQIPSFDSDEDSVCEIDMMTEARKRLCQRTCEKRSLGISFHFIMRDE